MLLKFIKLNYDLIYFWCLQHHHHHRPFNLIYVPGSRAAANFELKIFNFPMRNFRDGNSIDSRHPTTLIDIKISWFLLSQLSAFRCSVCTALPSHTGKLLFRSTQHNLSGYLCFVMCFMQFYVNPFYASYKDLFIYKPNRTAMAGKIRGAT